jgi:predicted RNase H-like HicB family nuclease
MSDSIRERDHASLQYYESVPYLLVMESVVRGGEWLRRAEYPELPGCAAEAFSAAEALEQLEQQRLRMLRDLWSRGAPIPVPRAPLLPPQRA